MAEPSSTPAAAGSSDSPALTITLKTGKWADEEDSAPSTPAPDAKSNADEALAKQVDSLAIAKVDPEDDDADAGGIDLTNKKYAGGGLIDWSGEVQVQQSDPNSPLYSVTSFEELNLRPELLKGVYAMKFNKPSKIQEKALPMILRNPPQNFIGQSQSGTGKTAAFTLGMLSRIDESKEYPQALCLAPTRELARQIGDVVNQMKQFTGIKVTFAIKDAVVGGKITEQVIVGTTGTILEWITKRKFDPKTVNILVCDEADQMIDLQGMGDQSVRIKKLLRPDIQILLFSATFKPKVMEFAQRIVGPKANIICLKREELSLEGIKNYYLDCPNEQSKFPTLSDIYGLVSVGQVVIFCQKRETVNSLAAQMVRAGHKVSKLTGEQEAAERDRIIDDFREGKTKVLIATNVLARGIDVLQVNVVINYDLPLTKDNKIDFETYLHRIGRTGRFGRKGVGINFTHDARSREQVKELEKFFGRQIVRVPTDDPEQFEKMLKL
eukprot:Opistho-2@56533